MNTNFCNHEFSSKSSIGHEYCHKCARRKGDYIYELEREVKRLEKLVYGDSLERG